MQNHLRMANTIHFQFKIDHNLHQIENVSSQLNYIYTNHKQITGILLLYSICQIFFC